MFSTPAASQLHRPPRRQKVLHQACLEMRQGFYTHNRIKEEPEEEVSPPADHQINQWLPQANQTIPWELLGDHHQRLEQEVLLC